MIIGPRYKIARRVGAPIFEKTQNAKYAQRLERKKKTARFGKPKSEFGLQLNEKQKARFTYGLTERQFANYVKEAIAHHATNAPAKIFEYLESRLDNVAFRVGLAPTRSAARQMVSHGHITVNGRRVTIPSYRVSVGDIIGIRPGSTNKKLFDSENSISAPSWISYDHSKKTATIQGVPQLAGSENLFDLNAVVEFYSR